MIKWHSAKTSPKLRKMKKAEGGGSGSGGKTSDRLLVWVTDHIGFGSFKVYEHGSSEGVHKHAFWSLEGHSGDWVVTHWAEITVPKGARVRK
jgi:hypothetical protein